MPSTPKISVVMPAYNAAKYLDEAVRSILDQTFKDFEFIIINNGSSDDTAAIIDKYQTLDGRIRVYYHEQQGWAPAFNYGCSLATGQYIAFMDADDVSLPRRLELQVEYLENQPQIGIVGTWIFMLKNGLVTRICPSTNSKMLKWILFYDLCVASSTVLMRREILEKLGFTRTDLRHAEDADLWLRASLITEFGNVPEVLYKYRVWPGSTTQLNLRSVKETLARLLASFIKEFLKVDPPVEALAGLRQMKVGPRLDSLKQIELTALLIQELYEKFLAANLISSQEQREITWDAAKKLGSLTLQASLFDTLGSMSLLMRALRLDYRLLSPSAILTGLERRRSFYYQA
jgi:glycosyltransferase involved in cell wall biosynthesis